MNAFPLLTAIPLARSWTTICPSRPPPITLATISNISDYWCAASSNRHVEEIFPGNAGQQATYVPLGKDLEPLTNFIGWQDQRSIEQCEEMKRSIGLERYYQIAGLPLDPIAAVSKIAWLKENQPDVFEKTRLFASTQNVHLHQLGVEDPPCDLPDAAYMGLLDVDNLTWSSELLNDLEDYPWPNPYDPARAEGLAEKCRYLYEQTDFALVGRFNNSIFEQAFMMRNYEQLLMDMALNPDFACALMDKLTDIAIGMIEVGLRECGPYIQILRLAGDDMGHQKGTLLSPAMFRNLVKPRFARLYKAAKDMLYQYNPNGKLMAHTDDDIYPIIPDYIEMGLDVLNPVQPDVPPENILAMRDAVMEYGQYPLNG